MPAEPGVILVVGEALIDEVRREGTPVDPRPGGSPANVAVGLARLGSPASLLTRFGRDPYGDTLRAHLEGNGVALVPGADAGGPTSVAAATIGADGGAAYDFRITWDPGPVDPGVLDGAACLHTGSLATALAPGADAVRELVARARGRALVSYDPNLRPALLPEPERVRPGVEALVAASDVVKVSSEDLAWLLPGADLRDVAAAWLRLGPALVVVTRGERGCHAVTAAGAVDVPGVRLDVVDTIGAGDAFTAGLLDGLRRAGLLGGDRVETLRGVEEPTLRAVLDEATRASAITCGRAGADPPTWAELQPHG